MAEVVKVHGLRELQASLRALPQRIDRRVLNAALMAGARPMVAEARANAPVLKKPDPRRRPGTLRRNIRARPVRPREHTATVILGVRSLSRERVAQFKKGQRGKKRSADNPDDPFYWRFVEFGTSRVPGQPFLRPAFEAKKHESVEAIKAAIARRIEVEAKRLYRPGAVLRRLFR